MAGLTIPRTFRKVVNPAMPEMIDFHPHHTSGVEGKHNDVPSMSPSSATVEQVISELCVPPKSVVGYEQERVANMFGSHDWKVDHATPHGKKGVLIHFHCIRCDAEGFATVVNKERRQELLQRRNRQRR